MKTVYQTCFCTKHKEIEQLHMNLAFPAISLHSEKTIYFLYLIRFLEAVIIQDCFKGLEKI